MGFPQEYERPYTKRQMLAAGYAPALVRKLMADPVHAWRAKTGIELIHKEPDLEEAIRVWVNWNRMSAADKAKSDRKSKRLFGVDNRTHYEQLRPAYATKKAGLVAAAPLIRAIVHLQKAAAAVAAPQALTPPASDYRPPAGVPAPKPAGPIPATVAPMGLQFEGYDDSALPKAQSAGAYATSGLNYLASMPEFQRRVGGGDAVRGRIMTNFTANRLRAIPVSNEAVARGVAMAHTRNGDGSSISMPAKTMAADGSYRGSGLWRNGVMTHETAHPFANKLPGYVHRIRTIQQEEGIEGTDRYHRTPKEQAAEFNALRVLKGAWPGHGAGPGGAYTPEQADSILNDQNPYFKGLPTNYKMRLLNEARNRRGGVPRYAAAWRGFA